MGNKKTATRRQKSAKIQPLRLQGAGANLFYVYSKLIEYDRRSVEVLLDTTPSFREGQIPIFCGISGTKPRGVGLTYSC
jgi:hypothetical protein